MSPVRNATRGLCSPNASPSCVPVLGRASGMLLAALTMLTLSSTGCSVVHNGYSAMTKNGSWNETVVVLRNRSFSMKAWHKRKHRFCREKHTKDFCNGFRAGYESVASGSSNGCTPAFPPSEYWSWEYQSAEGQAKTGAWYSGYPQGARAAEEDGVSNWNQVPMSAGMQAEYQQAGILTHEGALYPIPDPNAPEMPAAKQPAIMVPMADGSRIPLDAIPLGEGERILPQSINLPLSGSQ